MNLKKKQFTCFWNVSNSNSHLYAGSGNNSSKLSIGFEISNSSTHLDFTKALSTLPVILRTKFSSV